MATYRVQMNDTPAAIAARFGHANAVLQLIAANPQKATTMIDGLPTWRSLRVGELIALPSIWRITGVGTAWSDDMRKGVGTSLPEDIRKRLGIGAFGLGDVNSDAAAVLALDGMTPGLAVPSITVLNFQKSYNIGVAASQFNGPALQEDGEYGAKSSTAMSEVQGSVAVPAGLTSFSAESQADLVRWANAIAADGSVCNGQPNDNVLAFQDTNNHLGMPTLASDGIYGKNTDGAMIALKNAGSITSLPSCSGSFGAVAPPSGGPAGGGSGSGGGSGGSGSGITTINNTNAAPSSMVPWLIGGLAIAGGIGAFMYLNKHKGKPGKPGAHPTLMRHRARRARRH